MLQSYSKVWPYCDSCVISRDSYGNQFLRADDNILE